MFREVKSMDIKYSYDTNKSIYGVEKMTMGDKIFLRWKSTGLSMFLVLFSDEADAINLNLENPQEKMKTLLSNSLDKLMCERIMETQAEDFKVYLVTHDQLMREGGLLIKEIPGSYSIYGFEQDDSAIRIHLGEENNQTMNTFTMMLDVAIEETPCYIEKGFLRKKQAYSGYRKIKLKKGYPSIKEGVLKYVIDKYAYNFPSAIVEKGGFFYVNVAENDKITFKTNNPSIRIK